MKKTNYLQKTMMLFGTSLLVLTAFTSCSEKEEIFIPKESIETKGIEQGPGPGPAGPTFVKYGEWKFITPIEMPAPDPGPGAPEIMSSGKVTFFVNVSNAYMLNIKTLINNSEIIEYNNVFIGSKCIPGRGVEATWQGSSTVRVVVSGPYSSTPVGVYVTL